MRIRSLILAFLVSPFLLFSQTFTKNELRNFYLKATENAQQTDSLMNKLMCLKSISPCEQGYLGMCHGLKAQQAEGMWAKYKQVLKSKSHLNEAIERDPKDPELRFLRFTIEHFLPPFLLMSGDIKEDLAVIFNNPTFIDDNPKTKKMVIEFILWTNRASPEQNEQLKKILEDLKKKLG